MTNDQFLKAEDELLDQAIADYLRAEAVGQAGEPQQWLDRYPTCAVGLAEFFDDRQRLGRLVSPTAELECSPVPQHDVRTDVVLASQLSAGVQTVNFAPEPPRLSATRYRPIRFHARGGMGEIWLTEDERIGRRVAVKKLRAGRSESQERFFAEAQITGQLEHPSIVPLHDLGLDESGQPFYVMKFIQGRGFREVIAEYHAQKTSCDWPNDLAFRQLLQTFVSVCNVIAYAHSKAVLHRDIKPDNVMLGPYGETLVVDWGLAKIIGHPEDPLDKSIRISSSGSTATQDGAIVGSPLYMSPEVAQGLSEAIDQSSDVYLLGATLYEIITARPPRQGGSQWELIALARHSQPAAPRTLDARVPRALEAICIKALAFDKHDRYPTPLALAEDIQRFLAGEPTTAYREPLLVRAWRWVRRHRIAIVRGLVSVCVLMLFCFAFYGYRRAQLLSERERTREQLTEFHRLADESQFFAANTDTISERVPYYDPQRAEKVGEAALAICLPWGENAQKMPLVEHRDDLLKSRYSLLLLLAQVKLHAAPSEASAREALTLLDRAAVAQTPSRGNFELRSQCHRLLGDVRAAEADKYRANAPDTSITPQDHFLAGEALRLKDVGASGRVLGDENTTGHREQLAAAVNEYRQALALDPQHYWARYQLGRCMLALGRGPEAIEVLSACIALRPASPWAYSMRGLANGLSGRPREAIADLDDALRFDPDFQPARLNRGVVHWLEHENEPALADFAAVLAAPPDKRISEAAFYRGQVLLEQNRELEALTDFTAVISDRPQLQAAYWLRAKTHFQLGDIDAGLSDVDKFSALGRPAANHESAAEQHFARGKALRIMAQQLPAAARTKPLRVAAKELQAAIAAGPPTADMWQQLGAVRELLENYSEVVGAYSQGLALDNNNVALRNLRAWNYANQKKYELAQGDFTKSIQVMPSNAEAHAGLGFVLAELGRSDAAREEASIALLAATDSQLILHNVACVYARLSSSDSPHKTEYENLALAALDRAVTLSKQRPIGLDTNEVALIRDESAFPEALKSRPEFERLIQDRSPTKRN